MTASKTDPTAALGCFEDWNITRPTAVHMLKELARGHHEDAGVADALGGLPAVAGLNIALIADEGRSPDDMVSAILYQVRWLAITLGGGLTEEQEAALQAIIDATDAWKA